MSTSILLTALLVVAAVAPVAAARPNPHPACQPERPFPLVLTAGPRLFYLVHDRTGDGWWLYEETNKKEGLQRGGSAKYLDGRYSTTDTTCWHQDDTPKRLPITNPDTLLF